MKSTFARSACVQRLNQLGYPIDLIIDKFGQDEDHLVRISVMNSCSNIHEIISHFVKDKDAEVRHASYQKLIRLDIDQGLFKEIIEQEPSTYIRQRYEMTLARL